jgi:succinate dehydrogenase / fumarate reductase, cytochrome b subunit
MAVAIGKESYFWHKLHSLTGIIPVGFYMVQHLALNSFSIAGAEKYNSVSAFFYSIPSHLLLALEALAIWLPLLFHSVYGLFITARAEQNYLGTNYKWSQNRMYFFQRLSGIFIFLFLIYHVTTTTIRVKIAGTHEVVDYASMGTELSRFGYAILLLYALGVLASSYHFSYGIWNFCIRWGISISDRAQLKVQKFAMFTFVALTLLGWAALAGFFIDRNQATTVEVFHQQQLAIQRMG